MHLYSSILILCHPDPKKQFILEVDASDTGVQVVLSQRALPNNNIHPTALFSRCLSPAENIYNVGHRELLAVKLALEECRHVRWHKHLFLIWTDHKILTCLKDTKHLDPRWAHWSLFFTRFNYVLTFRPGSKNVKLDALSHQFAPPTSDNDAESIIPPSCVVGFFTWTIEKEVRHPKIWNQLWHMIWRWWFLSQPLHKRL